MTRQPAYALLSDGATVLVRPAAPDDLAAVQAMHEAMSPESSYLRFFSASQLAAAREAARVCREPAPEHAALLALCGGEVVGCASYERVGDSDAEVAFAVADRMQHRGVATLLLEHLVSQARDDGIAAFVAETLPENRSMLRVFADAGLPVRNRSEEGVVQVTIPLPRDDTDSALDAYLSVVDKREGAADSASLRPLLAPRSVVVICAEGQPGGAGRAILDNIRTGGYQGRLYAVHPHARQLGGVHCQPAVSELPEAPDLAIIAVPAAAVAGTAEDCGARGVPALAVVTGGLDAGACANLLSVCRRHGMRLAGPGSLGVAVPAGRLDATLAASHPVPGIAGLVAQSGGLGVALADQLSRLGIGISSFASVGRKLDVSANDLLLWWEHDGITRLAVLSIESFGNPRKFARTARRVAATMPVLTVGPGQPGDAAARARRQALFEQAGIIAVTRPGELTEVAALLATQPVPRGGSVAIVSNVRAAAALAADACAALGLTVHQPGGITRRRLRPLVPEDGSVNGPVDLTATVSGRTFQRVLELVGADEGVDAVIAIGASTAVSGDLATAVRQAAVPVPLAAVLVDQAESVRLLDSDDGRRVPAYGAPDAAVGALARAVVYGQWRAEPAGQVPAFPDAAAGPARELIRGFLARVPGGGWASPGTAAALLACYGMTVRPVTAGGVSVRIGVTGEPVFGPLVVFEPDGASAAAPGRQAARLVPLTTTDADSLISLGRGRPGLTEAALDGLRDLLLRVARLAEDLPEVSELSLDPVVAGPDGAFIAGARVRVVPCEHQDPFLRRLR